MEYVKAEDNEGLTNRHVFIDVDGQEVYEIGVYRVLFGFRVRGGRVGEMVYDLDYCCRTNFQMLGSLLAVCLARLSTLEDFDHQSVRAKCPVYGDKLFRNLPLLTEFGLEHFYEPPCPSPIEQA